MIYRVIHASLGCRRAEHRVRHHSALQDLIDDKPRLWEATGQPRATFGHFGYPTDLRRVWGDHHETDVRKVRHAYVFDLVKLWPARSGARRLELEALEPWPPCTSPSSPGPYRRRAPPRARGRVRLRLAGSHEPEEQRFDDCLLVGVEAGAVAGHDGPLTSTGRAPFMPQTRSSVSGGNPA